MKVTVEGKELYDLKEIVDNFDIQDKEVYNITAGELRKINRRHKDLVGELAWAKCKIQELKANQMNNKFVIYA